MKKYLFLPLVVVLQGCCWFGSCGDEPSNEDRWENGIQVSKKYLWKKHKYYSYTDWEGVSVLAEDWYYKNGYFSGSNPKKGASYYGLWDIETGKPIWRLPNTVKNARGYTEDIDLRVDSSHRYQHYVITQSYYPLCFNLKTGKIQWQLKGAYSRWLWSIKLGAFEDKYFCEYEYAKDKYALYEINIVTGVVKEVFKFVNKNPSLIASREMGGQIKPFRDAKGDLLIIMPIWDYYKNKESKYYLELYNYTQKKWVYRGILINSKYGCAGIQIYENKIFLMMSQGFACHRLDTGEEIWSTRRYNKFINSGPQNEGAVLGNKLVAAMGDDHIMCLDMDADRERVLWRVFGEGNSVYKLHLLNGIVYFASGELHALDVATGKYLWHLESPDIRKYGSGAFFKNGIWVVPGKGGKKGRVVAATYRSDVCYEAIK